jgi:sulfotransferase family protein
MKVFGIGLGRTGTVSLTKALEALGFTSIHLPLSYGDVVKHDSATDTPVATGYKYLDYMFPDSRYILTVRPIDDWLASIDALFAEQAKLGAGMHERFHRLNFGLYRTSVFDEKLLREAYQRHQDDVTGYFRGRSCLLTLDVTAGDAYPPLCEFLGVPVPETPFPHLNRRVGLRELMASAGAREKLDSAS